MAEEIEVKRVLMLADFGCNSGFAQVAHNIVAQVMKDPKTNWAFDIIGINYYGMPTDWQQYYPRIRVIPATQTSHGDLFGRQGFLDRLVTGFYDVVFILQDTFIVETIAPHILEIRKQLKMAGKKVFKWIYYFPIDAKPKDNWVSKSVALADIPVSYTQYGYKECVAIDSGLERKLKVIPHGIDTETFRPLPKEDVEKFRKEYFMGKADGKWLVTNVNRNQPRKDIARTIQVFSLLKNQVPNAALYLHMKRNDVAYDLVEVARSYGLTEDDIIYPKEFNEHDGIPVQYVNSIYNASNVVFTSTLGEGWGLSLTEAMAAGTPVVAPNHTSCAEILADGRGVLVQAGRSIVDWFVMSGDNERARPLMNVTEAVDKLAKLYRGELKVDTASARQFLVDNWTWDSVGKMWIEVFNEALIQFTPAGSIGRNDPCHCGSGLKFKRCHGAV